MCNLKTTRELLYNFTLAYISETAVFRHNPSSTASYPCYMHCVQCNTLNLGTQLATWCAHHSTQPPSKMGGPCNKTDITIMHLWIAQPQPYFLLVTAVTNLAEGRPESCLCHHLGFRQPFVGRAPSHPSPPSFSQRSPAPPASTTPAASALQPLPWQLRPCHLPHTGAPWIPFLKNMVALSTSSPPLALFRILRCQQETPRERPDTEAEYVHAYALCARHKQAQRPEAQARRSVTLPHHAVQCAQRWRRHPPARAELTLYHRLPYHAQGSDAAQAGAGQCAWQRQ
jgi:hypothetical protein